MQYFALKFACFTGKTFLKSSFFDHHDLDLLNIHYRVVHSRAKSMSIVFTKMAAVKIYLIFVINKVLFYTNDFCYFCRQKGSLIINRLVISSYYNIHVITTYNFFSFYFVNVINKHRSGRTPSKTIRHQKTLSSIVKRDRKKTLYKVI